MSSTAHNFFGAALIAIGYGLGRISKQDPEWIVLIIVATALTFGLMVYANSQEPRG